MRYSERLEGSERVSYAAVIMENFRCFLFLFLLFLLVYWCVGGVLVSVGELECMWCGGSVGYSERLEGSERVSYAAVIMENFRCASDLLFTSRCRSG